MLTVGTDEAEAWTAMARRSEADQALNDYTGVRLTIGDTNRYSMRSTDRLQRLAVVCVGQPTGTERATCKHTPQTPQPAKSEASKRPCAGGFW
jgi:hypothetical protein